MPRIIDRDEFRRVLGYVPTGVTAITASVDGRPVGMACNSFASVSLDPPLVSFCAAQTSTTWPAIRRAGRFCVNVLAGHHAQTSRSFSQRGIDRFRGILHHPREGGPGLEEAVAWIDCEIFAEHEVGDHVLVIGSVTALEARDTDRDPLIFFRGVYGSFAPSSGAP